MPDIGDHLLTVVSAEGSMSRRRFRTCFDELITSTSDLNGLSDYQYRFLFINTHAAFEMLGHIDVDREPSRIRAAPGCLVRLPLPGLPQAVLAGQRVPSVVEAVRGAVGNIRDVAIHVDRHQTDEAILPARITLLAGRTNSLEAVADQCNLAFGPNPAAWQIANLALPIERYASELEWQTGPDLDWPRRDFSTRLLQFAPADDSSVPMRLSQYKNPQGRFIHLLWKDRSFASTDRDLARFLCLRSEKRNVLLYHVQSMRLEVPVGTPLPRLLNRAVTLCSGQFPSVSAAPGSLDIDTRVWSFGDVPKRIAEVVADKLSQVLLYQAQ